MIRKELIDDTWEYTLQNEWIELVLLSYGARIHRLIVEGTDVALGYDTLKDVKNGTLYTGSTVGRFANRIGNASFPLHGKTVQLDRNEGNNHLHGGSFGFDRAQWEGKITDEAEVTFFHRSPDGEMGYPGDLECSVRYRLEKNAVSISYFAKTNRDTVINLTNHCYFNLSGSKGNDCREMMLQMQANAYLPVNEESIPTGEIKSVAGTVFDFTRLRKIESDYNHCFVLNHPDAMRRVATLYDPFSHRCMDVETDAPGMQLYNCISFEDCCGKDGIPLHPYQGIALETGFFPDSPNHPNFPSCLLTKDGEYRTTTKFRFYRK